MKRATDGLYVVTYQTGSTSVDIWSKASKDPYDWNVPQNPLSTAINSHDPGPIVLKGGTILVTSPLKGEGMEQWFELLRSRLITKRRARE